jgi:hypothetical protein
MVLKSLRTRTAAGAVSAHLLGRVATEPVVDRRLTIDPTPCCCTF